MGDRQTRVVHRRDLCTATQLLKSARAAFRAAGDANGIAEVDTTLIKIKADIVVQAVEDARKVSARMVDLKALEQVRTTAG